jgi:hypothetical protein
MQRKGITKKEEISILPKILLILFSFLYADFSVLVHYEETRNPFHASPSASALNKIINVLNEPLVGAWHAANSITKRFTIRLVHLIDRCYLSRDLTLKNNDITNIELLNLTLALPILF